MTITVGCIVGSLSVRSINRRLADFVAGRAPGDVVVDAVPIDGLPLYNHDLDADPPYAAREFKAAIESHDLLLLVTPEYNRSIPGALKNALDWGSRPWGDNSWHGRRAAVLGTGLNGAGTAVAQAHLRGVLGYLGVTVLGAPELCVPWTADVLAAEATAGFVDAFWSAVLRSLRDGRSHTS